MHIFPEAGISSTASRFRATAAENRTRLTQEETTMSSDKTYHHLCARCKKETPHVSAYPRPLQIALRTWQIAVFFITFAMVYPHTFSPDDEFAAKCTECGTPASVSYG
jgi:hypothetical protein